MTPLSPPLRASALTLCPLDGAVTHHPTAGLRAHPSPLLAAHYVAAHPGSRILCVGSSYNGGAGISVVEHDRLLEEARAAMRQPCTRCDGSGWVDGPTMATRVGNVGDGVRERRGCPDCEGSGYATP